MTIRRNYGLKKPERKSVLSGNPLPMWLILLGFALAILAIDFFRRA